MFVKKHKHLFMMLSVTSLTFISAGLVLQAQKVHTKICDGGHSCSGVMDCCTKGCCYTNKGPNPMIPSNQSGSTRILNGAQLLLPVHWYFWALLAACLAAIICLGALWRRRSVWSCCRDNNQDRRSEPDSNGSCYAPPGYSRCNSFQQAPPPYQEVTSKPDMYPLVISYGINCDPNSIKTAPTGYVMVQYFRNYILQPDGGSLSATSTIDSLSSSFLCNATGEANSVIPPPYSCTSSLDNFQIILNAPHSVSTAPNVQIERPDQMCSTVNYRNSMPPFNVDVSSGDHADGHHRNLSLGSYTIASPQRVSSASPSKIFHAPNNEVQIIGKSTPRQITIDMRQSSNTTSATCVTKTPVEFATHSKSSTSDEPKLGQMVVDYEKMSSSNMYNQMAEFDGEPSSSTQVPSKPANGRTININRTIIATTPIMTSYSDIAASNETSLKSSNDFERSNLRRRGFLDSVTNSITGSDVSSLANIGTPDSPPRATSPTSIVMRQLLDKIQQLPISGHEESPFDKSINTETGQKSTSDASSTTRHEVGYQPVDKNATPVPNIRNNARLFSRGNKAKTMYMPLVNEQNRNTFVENKNYLKSWMSRSAPVTPSANFTPTFPTAKAAARNDRKNTSISIMLNRNCPDTSPLLEETHVSKDDDDNEC